MSGAPGTRSFIKHHGLFVPYIDIIFRSNPGESLNQIRIPS